MSSESVTSSESRSNGIGPGDRLQAARIEKGLSVEDVANQMHLSVNILQSIEENNFEEITAPIFVKGYLRAYARIVSLGEEEMIHQYIKFYSDEDPPINSTSNTSPEISSGDTRVKWTTYIVILVLFGLLAAWWWNKSQDRSDVVSLDVDQSNITNAEPANDNPVVEQSKVISTSEVVVEIDPAPAVSPGVVEIIEQQAVETDQEEMISKVEAQVPDESTELTVESVELEATPIAAESELSNADIVSDTSTEQIQVTGSDVIKLTVHADTWADIKDANGNRLAYDLLRADRQLTLTGQAPFTVFFGNGHGVELTYNGEEVDVTSLIQNDNTARLKIGNN